MVGREIPNILSKISFDNIIRVDVALEGDWSKTVVPVWTKEDGFLGFDKVSKSHEKFKPSIEIYFPGYWIGIHCFSKLEGKNAFDEKLAKDIIDYIEQNFKKGRG